jgi:hypothetical protein
VIRLGLDLHGVIDKDPTFFSQLADVMKYRNHEIYIVTGREDCVELREELEACSMPGRLYNGILSITSYQKSQGEPVSYLDGRLSQPMMNPKVWNPTKAMLCATAGIDIMIDDSALYEPYFRDIKTQYIIYTETIADWLGFMFYQGHFTLRKF